MSWQVTETSECGQACGTHLAADDKCARSFCLMLEQRLSAPGESGLVRSLVLGRRQKVLLLPGRPWQEFRHWRQQNIFGLPNSEPSFELVCRDWVIAMPPMQLLRSTCLPLPQKGSILDCESHTLSESSCLPCVVNMLHSIPSFGSIFRTPLPRRYLCIHPLQV